jgi:uncharacterized protein (TIGR04255 family)
MDESTLSQIDIELTQTPKFSTPPIIETALGVQFKPLPKMRVTHFGNFQEMLEPLGFVGVQEHPPLPHHIEQAEKSSQMLTLSFNLMPANVLPRVWFISDEGEKGEQVVQLQSDRLFQNWRQKKESSSKYTSYSINKSKFENTLSLLEEFVDKRALGKLIADQCEITYVSQIRNDDSVSIQEHFKRCFKGIYVPSVGLEAELLQEAFGFNWQSWVPEINGRVFVQAGTASILGSDKKVIDLRIIARGKPKNASKQGIMDWLDLGHYFVVNTFANITTNEMQTAWGRHDVCDT